MAKTLRLLAASIAIAYFLHFIGIEGEDTCQLWTPFLEKMPTDFKDCNTTDQCLGFHCQGFAYNLSGFGAEFLPCNEAPQLTLFFNASNDSIRETVNLTSSLYTYLNFSWTGDYSGRAIQITLSVGVRIVDEQNVSKIYLLAFSTATDRGQIFDQDKVLEATSGPIPACVLPQPTIPFGNTATGSQATTPGVVEQTSTVTAVREITGEQTVTQAGGSRGSTEREVTVSMITHSSAELSTKQPVVPVKPPVKLSVSRRCRSRKYWKRNSVKCCKESAFKAVHPRKCSNRSKSFKKNKRLI